MPDPTTEKRATHLVRGDQFREFGDLDEEWRTVVNVDHRGDDVLVDYTVPDSVRVHSHPALDGDTVVEVLAMSASDG